MTQQQKIRVWIPLVIIFLLIAYGEWSSWRQAKAIDRHQELFAGRREWIRDMTDCVRDLAIQNEYLWDVIEEQSPGKGLLTARTPISERIPIVPE